MVDIQLFDNKGKTWDRYTAIINGQVFGMSENATSPQGFNQHAGSTEYLKIDANDQKDLTNRFGDSMMVTDAPREVKLAIAHRLRTE